MTNHKKFEKECRALLAKYVEVLNLQAYRMEEFVYKDDDDEDAIFRVVNNYPYKAYTIVYFPSALKEYNKNGMKYIKHGLLHELVHVVLAEYTTKAQSRSSRSELSDSEESVVDHLAIVLGKYVHDK